MNKTKKRIAAATILALSPLSANAGVIRADGFEDWRFDVPAYVRESGYEWEAPLDAEEKRTLRSGVRSGVFVISPSRIGSLQDRVEYFDDAFEGRVSILELGYFGAELESLYTTQLNGESPAMSVPEPGTLALIGLGLAGLATRRRRG